MLIEMQADLFAFAGTHTLIHCVSADFALGKGIALEFTKRYNMRNKLTEMYPAAYTEFYNTVSDKQGQALLVRTDDVSVINLVTKHLYWQKPTYTTLTNALKDARRIIREEQITRVAMPRIGCGLDRLQWQQVRSIIQDVFRKDDIEIIVCCL